VLVDLPASWRTAVWLLATWSVGACAVVPSGAAGTGHDDAHEPGAEEPGADVVVTASPQCPSWSGARLVAVALPALATRYPGDLPPGALDAAAEVRTYGDVFVAPVRPATGDPALAVRSRTLPHGGLLAAARAAADEQGYPDGVRLLTGAGPAAAVATLLAPLVRGGSVVLHHDLAGLDEGSRRHLAEQEAVTAVEGSP
jgi:uncharacterized protein (TIGR03089 family)